MAILRSPPSPSCIGGRTAFSSSRWKEESAGPATPSWPPTLGRSTAIADGSAPAGPEDTGWTVVETDIAPLEHLGRTMRRHPPVEVPGLPRFTGGAVGYLGYDIVRTIESLPDAPPDDRDLPDAILMVTDTLLVLDNLFNRATVIATVEVPAGCRQAGAAPAVRRGRGQDRVLAGTTGHADDQHAARDRAACRRCRNASGPYPDDRFQDDVRRIKEYIGAGRHLSDRALPAARSARAGSLSHLSLPAGAQSGAVPLLSPLRRHPHHRQLARDPGAGGGRRGHPSSHRRDPSPRRPVRAGRRRWPRSSQPIPRSGPST